MKKFISIVFATLVAIAPINAQSKQVLKSVKKEAKKAAQQLQMDGYRLLEIGDLQYQFEEYLLKVKSGHQQIVGTAEGCKSLNLAKITALSNALNEYAMMSGGLIKARIVSNTSNINGQQIDDIVAAFERTFSKEIKGEVQTYLILVKDNKNSYDIRTFCIIDNEAAHSARIKAMQIALEELQLSQEYGSAISDWIDEGQNK